MRQSENVYVFVSLSVTKWNFKKMLYVFASLSVRQVEFCEFL